MIDLKPEILQALRGNTVLVALLGRDRNGNPKVYPEVSPFADIEPYITFFELVNIDTRYSDNQPYNSEIHFQVDIWARANTSPFALEVDRTMKSISFYRTSSQDQYENDTNTHHKILRYKTDREIKEDEEHV